jgi:hypothetical protein
VNLPLPDGFAAMNALGDGAVVCCLATRKIVGRATRQGASNVVIYDLVTGDFTVVANPEGVTSTGPPPGGGQAAPAAGTRLILANSRANTISAVAYNANRQTGIIVVRVP